MCTRFYVEPETEEIRAILEEAGRSPLCGRFIRRGDAVRKGGEFRPSEVVPVVAPDRNGERAVFPMKWGYRVPGVSLIVNARSETAAVKPLFRESWERRRCAVPASWYYEWEHFKTPSGKTKAGDRYAILPRNETVTWLCGLYLLEDGLPAFTILTREPSESVRRIHDRMPLILPPERIGEWIRPDSDPDKLLRYALTDMVCEKA